MKNLCGYFIFDIDNEQFIYLEENFGLGIVFFSKYIQFLIALNKFIISCTNKKNVMLLYSYEEFFV